ncbi:Hypothetical predicted protein [Paramuricea clavata]|uniref:Uncharacterized protein n=1 Tax=Paramuricea clavata TaxID=317549 RepID=A0A6S7H5R7_PARCT|nr:Hypothetical predicted protein [Paramuricea clavata]
MTIKEINSDIRHNLVVDNSGTGNTNNVSGFDALSDDDKGKVEKVLFLLDKFCVGDAFYHEITMLVEGLPKSYLVKQRRDQLNKMCHITSTPGEEHGAQLTKKQDKRIYNCSPKCSAKGNHTIAVVKGKEDYDVLKHCFRDVFTDINDMLREKTRSGRRHTPDKKKLLKEHPEKLEGLIPPAAEIETKSLWIKFSIIYSIETNVFAFTKSKVTPYMHVVVYHVPTFLKTYKIVKLCSGQGVEKNNVARSIVLRKSNNWDAAADVLKLESRQWDLRKQECTEYWEHQLEEERKKRKTNDMNNISMC